MNSEMTLKQKIEAMVDDDSIISEESRQFDTETVDKLNKLLVEQIEDVLDYGWETTLVDIINDNQTEKNWGSMKIVRVIDDQIYSFELGVLTFRSDVYDMFYEPALVFFDYSTGKILYLALYFDYNVDYIGYDEFNNPSYIDALSQYYDMYINPENCDAFVAENAIWISPYTNEEILSNNFDDFYNYAYKIMDY
jgi:hypothetical protein